MKKLSTLKVFAERYYNLERLLNSDCEFKPVFINFISSGLQEFNEQINILSDETYTDLKHDIHLVLFALSEMYDLTPSESLKYYENDAFYMRFFFCYHMLNDIYKKVQDIDQGYMGTVPV